MSEKDETYLETLERYRKEAVEKEKGVYPGFGDGGRTLDILDKEIKKETDKQKK